MRTAQGRLGAGRTALFSALALAAAAAGCSGSHPRGTCPGFSSPGTGTGAATNVTGTVAYEDRIQDASGFTGATVDRPVREATVEVVRCSDGQVLGQDTASDAGAFSVSVSNMGPIGVYVRVLARIQGTDHDMAVRDTHQAVYAVRGNGLDERTAPPQSLLATDAAGIGAPFNILDNALASARYVDAAVGLGAGLQTLTLRWEADTTDYTAFLPTSNTVVILDQPNAALPDTDGYDDMVIRHEVGHYMADQLSQDDSNGGSHTVVESDQDARLSWSEGWANFFGGAVDDNPDYVDTFDPVPGGGGITFSLEDSLTSDAAFIGVGGAASEMAVDSTLWDALDGPGGGATDTDGDPADLGPVPILTAFMDLADDTAPVTFGSFWNALRVDPMNTAGELTGFRDAAAIHGIDLFEDDTTDDAPATGTALATPVSGSPTTADANLAWDAGASAGPDLDYYRVDLLAATTYQFRTTRLSDGADTLLQVLDPTGVTVLAQNDNYNGAVYTNCDATSSCPVNGPYPFPGSPEPLSSRIYTFTPPADATYVVLVTRSAAPPPSAGLFGGYRLEISAP